MDGKQKEQKFIVAPESEIELVRARQKLAITIGVIALTLLLVGSGIAFLLIQKYQQGLVQLPSTVKKAAQGFVQAPATQGIQPQPPADIAQSVKQEPSSAGLVQTPPSPPVPLPVQQTQQGIPAQSLLEQPKPKESQTLPVQQFPVQPQRPTIPAGLLDYLEQLKRIEMQRKREANNYWIALQALSELLQVMQGAASTGDILNAPDYNPQRTLQAYDAYQQRFSMLRQWLHKLQPPPECQQLHQAYDQALLAHINAVASLKQRITLKDLAGAALSGLTTQKQINFALSFADNELSSVCQRYGIPKPFTIGDNR